MPEQTLAPKPSVKLRSWERDQKLRRLGFANYSEYIASPEWADVRARYKRSIRPQDCGLCGTSEKIEIHHLTYERVGEEELSDLTALCRDCHSMLHTLERRGDIEGLDFAGLVDEARAKRNRERMAERLGPVAIDPGQERRNKNYRSAIAQFKGLVIAAERRKIDVTEEMTALAALTKSLNDKVQSH